jgi:protocatechuate 4,5-dioxygenase, beta chain
MAEVVGGFLLPHDPLIFQMPDAAPVAQRATVHAAYDEIRQRIGELQADVAVIVGSDHYILFGPQCLPSMLIGTGDVDGPIERLPGLDRGPVRVNPGMARHLLHHGREAGFDWAAARTLTIDHAIGIPYRLCVHPNDNVACIPVYLASGVEPLISMKRARALGAMMRDAIQQWQGDERVVVIGSGGISHWVGMAEMGKVNPVFDKAVLQMVEEGNLDALSSLTDDYLLEHGGNGALEIRNFVCAMAVMGSSKGRIIAYEPSPEWITGLGFAELEAA